MARGARGVTCHKCGCLNFSSEHKVCDKCRSKAVTFRPTARRQVSGTTGHTLNTSSSRRSEDSDRQVHSSGKKRRYDETKSTSNKRHEDKREKPKQPSATKQPDVIDLISDEEEEEDVVVQKVTRGSLQSPKKGKREEIQEEGQQEDKLRTDDGQKKDVFDLFQSRLFTSVTFVESHFPSMEAGAMMRKRAAEKGLAHSQPAVVGVTATTVSTVRSGQVSASQPVSTVSRPAQKKVVEPKPMEPRPPPVVVEESKQVEKKLTATSEKKTLDGSEATDSTTVQGTQGSAASIGAEAEEKDAVQAEQEKVSGNKEDPLFQSRVFDSIEFQASDFVTVFDGLAVARRSHPPTSKLVATASNAATSTPVEPTVANANDVTGPAKATTVASSTTAPAAPSTTTKTSPEAKAPVALPSESVARKVPATTPAVATTAKSSTTPPIASASHPVSKPPVASAATAAPRPPTASGTPTPTAVKALVKVPVAPPTKAPLQSSQASSTPGATMKAVATATVSPKSPPTPAAVKLIPAPAASASSTMKPTPTAAATATKTATPTTATPPPTTFADPAVTKASSVPTTHSERTLANGSANVLLPKKKHPEGVRRTDEEQRHQKPSSIGVNASSDADGVRFIKVNAAPRDMVPVEPPVLGYCSPEFLQFMRECGDDDGDEEDDPEEVSRSQLKLLDVVDLTNLSDSEDSDTGSPLPTPRVGGPNGGVQQQISPTNEQVGGVAAVATVNMSGKGTWYVPTLDSDRKRTQPAKVMCELCEEKGLPSRLIRCPTCSKYYHKKCARENGDENICWNCELGSMIDDSELDEEHAKHNSEYLAYLKAIRRSPEDGEGAEDEGAAENGNQEGDDVPGEEGVEMASSAEGGEDSHPSSDESNSTSAGKRWKEFIGDATADVDASYLEVTNRIAEELRDDEKRRLYSRGFVSRGEFEAQMAEVEEYYISEEARLQQLEREKALEAKKVAEARKTQAAAEHATNAEQAAGSSATGTENNATSMMRSVVQDGANAGGVSTSEVLPSTTIAPPGNAPKAPMTVTTAPMPVPTEMHSASPHPAAPTAVHTSVAASPFTATFAAAFRAAFTRASAAGAPPPASKPL